MIFSCSLLDFPPIKCFVCIYFKSKWSISNIVYLLPLLFSFIANLGQLFATKAILSAWLLFRCASQEGLNNLKVFYCNDECFAEYTIA